MDSTAQQVFCLNLKYFLNNGNGKKTAARNYRCFLGKTPVILSAPHAVKQVRNGREKSEDVMTGGIVEYLCQQHQCYGITRIYNAGDDPNSDFSGPGFSYKEQILHMISEKEIKLFLDIHGCSMKHGFDFCIGTNCGKNLNGNTRVLEQLYAELGKIGKTAVDDHFKASREGNICRYIAERTEIPCIQLEISRDYRMVPDLREAAVEALGRVLECV